MAHSPFLSVFSKTRVTLIHFQPYSQPHTWSRIPLLLWYPCSLRSAYLRQCTHSSMHPSLIRFRVPRSSKQQPHHSWLPELQHHAIPEPIHCCNLPLHLRSAHLPDCRCSAHLPAPGSESGNQPQHIQRLLPVLRSQTPHVRLMPQ